MPRSLLLLLALLVLALPTASFAGGGDDDDSVANDDDATEADDDDSASFYSATVPLDERVLGGGCEDGQSCALGVGGGPGLSLLLLGGVLVRRRR